MATITYVPKTSTPSTNWNDPQVWSGGVVPNDPTVDVIIPTARQISNGGIFVSTISETGNFSIGSLRIFDNNLAIGGTLSVAGDFLISGVGTAQLGGLLTMQNGALSVGSFDNAGQVSASGTINSAGLFVNEKALTGTGLSITTSGLTNNDRIISNGLDITTSSFTNNGTISGFNLNLAVSPGGFTNLTGVTLTGGSYNASGSLNLNVGGVIAVDAANITLSGGMINSFDDVSQTYSPLSSSLHQIAAGGTLLLSSAYNWTDLTVDGLLVVTSGFHPTQLVVHAGGTVNYQVPGRAMLDFPTINDGAIVVGGLSSILFSSNQLLITTPVTGSGTLEIAVSNTRSVDRVASTLELGPSAVTSQDVVFRDRYGILILDNPSIYSGHIVPTGAGDQIIIPGISVNSITSYSYSGNGTGGTLAIHTASGEIDLNFLGSFVTENFTLSAAQNLSTDPPILRITNIGGYHAGTPGNDNITLPSDGTWIADGGAGYDTVTFAFSLLSNVTITHSGDKVNPP